MQVSYPINKKKLDLQRIFCYYSAFGYYYPIRPNAEYLANIRLIPNT